MPKSPPASYRTGSTPPVKTPPVVGLTIAGSDPSGGAGLQADLKTFHQHGVYGTSVVTLLTVQNTLGVSDVQLLDAALVVSQLDAVLSDVPPAAAKTGALGSVEIIEAVAAHAAQFSFPLIVDPVMISKHGHSLISDEASSALRDRLVPQATLITPNRFEAARLTGVEIVDEASLLRAGEALLELGAQHVLIKGGQLFNGNDFLWSDGNLQTLLGDWIVTTATHGTGCVLSAAITARMAYGEAVLPSVIAARRFVQAAIQSSSKIGAGVGPVNLHAALER